MFDFATLTGMPPTSESSTGDPQPGTGDSVPASDPATELPPGMLLVDGAIPVAPPYWRRTRETRSCRWIESRQNEVLETNANCVTVLVARECTTVTTHEVSWALDGPWFPLPAETEREYTLRKLTICDGAITDDADPPDEWQPDEDEWKPEEAATEAEADDTATSTSTDHTTSTSTDSATTSDADSSSSSDGTPTSTDAGPSPNETPEQREQRLRDKAARRAVDRDALDPDRPPAGIGGAPPPPVTGPDGLPGWKPDSIIADVLHGYSERRDEGNHAIVVWYVWIAVDVQRSGCLWIAVYHSYKITFRIDRATGAVVSKTVVRDTRPPTTRTQVIPGCMKNAMLLRGAALTRETGGTVALAGRFPIPAGERVSILVKSRDGIELAREDVETRGDGTFAIAFDVETTLEVHGEDIVIEAFAREGALRSETNVRLLPPAILASVPLSPASIHLASPIPLAPSSVYVTEPVVPLTPASSHLTPSIATASSGAVKPIVVKKVPVG